MLLGRIDAIAIVMRLTQRRRGVNSCGRSKRAMAALGPQFHGPGRIQAYLDHGLRGCRRACIAADCVQ